MQLKIIEKISDKYNNVKRNYVFIDNNGIRIMNFIQRDFRYIYSLYINDFHRGRYSSTRLATP